MTTTNQRLERIQLQERLNLAVRRGDTGMAPHYRKLLKEIGRRINEDLTKENSK